MNNFEMSFMLIVVKSVKLRQTERRRGLSLQYKIKTHAAGEMFES